MTTLEPNEDHIRQHLHILYDWITDDSVFEIRCLLPDDRKSLSNCFPPTEDGLCDATLFAAEANRQGYNIYSVVNPVKAGTDMDAQDGDVEDATFHFIDCDGTDTDKLGELIAEAGFVPAFIVETGTIPSSRKHVGWQMSKEQRDLVAWRDMQKRLAQYFGTDRSVHNPSRIMRLAGTISYATKKKQARGYVTELTRLEYVSDSQVETASFYGAFPELEQPVQTEEPDLGHGIPDLSDVPLAVLHRAFSFITDWDDRDTWRNMGCAAKEANSAEGRTAWDTWSRHSLAKYNANDQSTTWKSLKASGKITRATIFGAAKQVDSNWWRDGGDVEAWWKARAKQRDPDDQLVCDGAKDAPMLKPLGCEHSPKPRFKRYKMTELLNMKLPVWLIKDMLFEQQIAVFCATSGSYKSFIALAISCMLAHEMTWMGRKLKKRRVVYLAGEGFPLFGHRRMAWNIQHGKQFEDDGLEIIDGTVNLLDDKDVDAFIESMKDCPDIDLLTIDTLSTSTAGEDENTSPVMTKAVVNAKRMSRALKCAVLIIHHPGKDITRGLRGHSSLGANIDSVWIGEKTGNKVKLVTEKQRDGEDKKVFYFHANSVDLGVYDDEGIEMTSLALTPCDAPTDEEIEIWKNRIVGKDLDIIVKAMKINQGLSVAELAKLVALEFQCGDRTAKKRINAAVPADTWTKTMRLDRPVTINRFAKDAASGQPHKIFLKQDDGD